MGTKTVVLAMTAAACIIRKQDGNAPGAEWLSLSPLRGESRLGLLFADDKALRVYHPSPDEWTPYTCGAVEVGEPEFGENV